MASPADLPRHIAARVLASRAAWINRPLPIDPPAVKPDGESVWDYPRPPRIDPVALPVRVVFAGRTIAETTAALRICETASPPTIYIPARDVAMECLVPASGAGICEWKGVYSMLDVVVGGRRADGAAWTFPDPFDDLPQGYAAIAGHIAFYPGPMDGCFIGDERVRPQPGRYYGGWVTGNLTGPFKGEPGSEGW